MSKQQSNQVHNIELDPTQPTSLSFEQLYEWVIWQFCKQTASGLSGAVRPPIPGSDWYPAVIHPKEKRVQIYGHLDSSYDTPEKAAAKISKIK
ncbi:MAG: hypothetical protein IAF02_01215 [Anaerolineae bacterium]|nr:hypothetical protein [Anaerolineae bacterium]